MAGREPGIGDVLLLVDDEEDVLMTLTASLELEGYEVAVAHNAVEAIELLRTLRPAAVVTDVMMPGGSGISLLGHVRASAEYADTPVLLISGSGDADVEWAVAHTKRTAFLQKPIGPATVIAEIKKLLSS